MLRFPFSGTIEHGFRFAADLIEREEDRHCSVMKIDDSGSDGGYNQFMDRAPETAEFRLGEWLVQPSLNRLSNAEGSVRLEPKVMNLLTFLAQRPGEVVSKDELVASVWEGQFITDTAISRAVAGLRRALGDDEIGRAHV